MEKELRLQIPLYMLVLRDLVGIEPLGGLYRPLAGGRKPRGLLRSEPATRCRDTRATTTWTRTLSGPRSRRRAGPRGSWPSGSAPATSATTRRAASARPGATSGRCAAWSGHELDAESRAARGDRGDRPRVRLRRGRDGEDRGAGRALRPRGLRPRRRRRVDPRHHLHEARRRGAARPHPQRAARAAGATTWRGRSTAPGSRRSTASATGC